MKKFFAWLGIFAMFLSLFSAVLGPTKADAAFNYKLQGLKFGDDPSVNGSWTTGNVCAGGSGCYSESDNVPVRLTIEGLTTGAPYSLGVQHDYKNTSGVIGYENFNRTAPLQPDDYASGVGIVLDADQTDDAVRNYTLSFTALGDTAVVYWNALLGVDASDFGNGASLHFRLVRGVSGETIGNKEVPISPDKLLELPSITLTKTIDSGTAAPDLWDFNVSPSINGTSTYNIPDGQSSVIINNVPDGTYTINEANGASGYQFVSGDGTNCTFSGAEATATVSAGDPANSAVCNFHNTASIGGITVHKDVVGPNGEALVDTSQNFNIYLDGGNVTSLTDGDSHTYSNVSVGTHTITELSLPTGYTLYNITPDGDLVTPGAQVSVTYGQITHVYVTNRQIASTVIVHKDVKSPSGAQVADNHSFTASIDGDNKTISENTNATYALNPGSYTLTELTDVNYTLDSITPDSDSGAAGAQFSVSPGETKHLYVVNKQKSARIIVYKDVLDPYGVDVSDSHPFTVLLNGLDPQSISEGSSYTYTVDPYTDLTVSEQDDTAYTEDGCYLIDQNLAENFQAGSNETVEVVCINKQIASVVRIYKDVRLSNGTDISDNTTFTVSDGTTPKDLSELTIAEYILPPGTYTFTEDSLADYFIHSITPDDDTSVANGTTITLSSGEEVRIDFVNYREIGQIEVTKNVNPPDDDSLWNFEVSGTDTYNVNDLADGGKNQNSVVRTGTYTITETSSSNADINDYTTSYVCYIDDEEIVSGEGTSVTEQLGAYQTLRCVFTNTIKRGSVTVEKYNDLYANGERDQEEGTLSGWEFDLSGNKQTSDENGIASFDDLLPDDYTLTETLQEGWDLTDIDCSSSLDYPITKSIDPNNQPFTLHPNEEIFCSVGNHFEIPTLTIEKSNNREGIDSQVGDIVTYQIVVTALGNIVDDVRVSDTLPASFSYILGSFGVTSSTGGDITDDVTEPNYAGNVAVWDLGTLQEDEVITITYQAIIGEGSTDGTYRDNAWTSGESLLDDKIVGSAGTIGQLDDSFVGTSIKVVQIPTVANIYQLVKSEKVVIIPAVATTLPETGSSPWMAVTLAFLLTNLVFIIAKLRGKATIALTGIVLVAAFAFPPSVSAHLNSLDLQIKSVASPTSKSNLKIDYVIQDLENRDDILVECFKNDVLFQFNNFDKSGSGSCDLANSPLTTSGSYQIKIEASVLGDPADTTSKTASFDYFVSNPGTPTNYQNNSTSCDATISFTTANDGGKTVGVEVFRSDSKTIVLSSANKIDTVSVGSGQNVSKTYFSPDCSKTYYYAIRAFDTFSNYSGVVGDTDFTIVYIQEQSPATTQVSTATSPRIGSSSTGTNVSSTAQPGDQPTSTVEPPTENQSQVAGAETETKGVSTESDSNNKLWLWIIIAVVVLAGAGGYLYYRKRNQS